MYLMSRKYISFSKKILLQCGLIAAETVQASLSFLIMLLLTHGHPSSIGVCFCCCLSTALLTWNKTRKLTPLRCRP